MKQFPILTKTFSDAKKTLNINLSNIAKMSGQAAKKYPIYFLKERILTKNFSRRKTLLKCAVKIGVKESIENQACYFLLKFLTS